ncbi:OrU22, partial [Eciton burchellii]
YEWVVTLNRVVLRLLGVWPERQEITWKASITNIRVIVVLNIIVWSSAVPALHSFIRIWGDITSMIDNLQYTLPLFVSLMKFILLWQKKDVLVPVLEMVKTDWLKLKTKEEKAIMIKRAQIARAIMMWGCFVMLLSFIFVVILPSFGISIRYLTNITDPGRLLPLQTYYLYEVSNSPFYEATFLLQSFSLMATATLYTSADTFMSLLIFHVCGQLENLKARILNLKKSNNFTTALSFNVQDHIRLIRFIKIIDSTFSLMLLGLLVYFGILFSLYGFLFVTIMTQGRNLPIARLIFLLLIFINTFTHMCLYCAVGEFLVIRCEGIYEAACQYEWYKLEPKQAKNFLNIIMQARCPLYLTAGKLFPMTIATLGNLLKTSGGYISVLLAHRS